MDNRTLINIFTDHARGFHSDIIVRHKPEKGRRYVDVSWNELSDLVQAFASGLIELGLAPGDHLAILSANRLEWIVADLGVMMAGGVSVPIYHTNTPEQCEYILRDAAIKYLVVEDLVQLYKVQLKLEALPDLKAIILIEGSPPQGLTRIISHEEMIETGHKALQRTGEELELRMQQLSPQNLATVVYTSGTTGPPKGCMISHGNIMFVLNSTDTIINIDKTSNLSLLILPMSHFFPRVSGCFYNIYKAIPLALVESADTIGPNMVEARPTYFCSVPRIFEKVYARIVNAVAKKNWVQRRLFGWAVSTGRKRAAAERGKAPWPPALRLQMALADKLVLGKIRDSLGGRISFALSAGAPLSANIGEFINALGIKVIEFYGLTETIGGTMTTLEEVKYGTVGKAMPGFEVRMAADGEILIKGNNFMGYLNRPDLTAEVIKDGWCFTGDVGRMDDEGFLMITDRKKDLIITSGGKNIAPQNLENMLKQIPLVANAMVFGDRQKYLTALITLDRAETEQTASEKGITYAEYGELTERPEIKTLIQEGLDQVNSKLAKYETIKKFAVLPEDFTPERGEVTPTLKVKRKVIVEKYRDLLESLYESDLK